MTGQDVLLRLYGPTVLVAVPDKSLPTAIVSSPHLNWRSIPQLTGVSVRTSVTSRGHVSPGSIHSLTVTSKVSGWVCPPNQFVLLITSGHAVLETVYGPTVLVAVPDKSLPTAIVSSPHLNWRSIPQLTGLSVRTTVTSRGHVSPGSIHSLTVTSKVSGWVCPPNQFVLLITSGHAVLETVYGPTVLVAVPDKSLPTAIVSSPHLNWRSIPQLTG